MKLLPASKSIQEPIDVESKTIKVDKFLNITKLVLKIEKKVIKIDKLFKKRLANQIKLNEKLRVKKEEESFDKKEKELEKKKPKKMKGMNLPSLPSFGIFDWIKNFISNVVLGFIAVRLIKFLPDLIRLLPIISKVMDFFIDVGGKLLDSLVTFVDWGYKAYDATRGFIKNIFGEDGAKTFEDLSSKFSTFMNIALIAGMLALGGSKKSRGGLGGKGGKIGIDSKGRKVGTKAQERYQRRYGKGKFEDRFGTKNAKKLEKLRRTAAAASGARAAGTTGARTVAKSGARLATKGIPIVGPLIDFAVRTLIFHEPLGKAAAGAVGVAVGQALGGWLGGAIGGIVGSVIPIAGTLLGGSAGVIIGQLIGGFVGDAIGTSLYDFIGEIGGSTQLAGGGSPDETTRKSNVSGPAARTLKQKKTKRTLTPIPRKISPGASVGGKEKFQQLFPDTQKDNTDTTGKEKQNPYQYLTKSAENIGKAQYFGPLINLGMKANLGDTPNKTDYFLAAQGLNSWMNRILDFRGVAMAGGGEVNAQMLGMGEDYTRVIAKSLEESVSPSIDKTTKDLMRNLMLQKVEPKEDDKKPDEGAGADGEDGGESGAAGSSGDKITMARNLMRDLNLTAAQAAGIVGNMDAESGVENARPQGSQPGTKAPLKVDGLTGYGLVQWTTKGRQQGLADFARSKKADLSKPLSMDIEYQYFLKEFRGQYGHVLNQLKQAPDVKSASTIFMQQFEVPAGYKTEAKKMERYNKAKPIYDSLSRGEGKATEGANTYTEDVSATLKGKHGLLSLGGSNAPGGDRNLNQSSTFANTHRHHNLPDSDSYNRRAFGIPRDYVITRGDQSKDRGSPVPAGVSGTAKRIGGTYGEVQIFDNSGNKLARFLHNDTIRIQDGQKVSPNTIIGTQGNAGTGPVHVHLEANPAIHTRWIRGITKAYAKGGPTLDGSHVAKIGEEGTEYVIDHDSYVATEKVVPGLLDILNYNVHDVASLKRNMPSIVETLQQYTSYEDGSDSEIIVIQDNADDTNDTYPTRSSSSNSMAFSSGIDNKSEEFEVLHMV